LPSDRDETPQNEKKKMILDIYKEPKLGKEE